MPGLNVSPTYVTHIPIPLIIALNVAPVLNGIVELTTYSTELEQFLKTLLKLLTNWAWNMSKIVLEFITQFWLNEDGLWVGVGVVYS